MLKLRGKMAVSMTLIALLCVLIGGATFAWFTDTASNTNNTFSTGTLDLVLGNEVDASLSNMAPGDSQTGSFTLTNSGSLDMWYRLTPTVTGDFFTVGDEDVFTVKVGGADYTAGSWLQLAAGANVPVEFTVSLNTSAGNEYQDKTGTVSFKADAQQVKNNPNKEATTFVPYPTAP